MSGWLQGAGGPFIVSLSCLLGCSQPVPPNAAQPVGFQNDGGVPRRWVFPNTTVTPAAFRAVPTETQWSSSLGQVILLPPAVVGSVVVVTTAEGTVLGLSDGRVLWSIPSDGPVPVAGPTRLPDHHLVVLRRDGSLLSLNQRGTDVQVLQLPVDDCLDGLPPVVLGDGTLAVVCSRRFLQVLPDGSVLAAEALEDITTTMTGAPPWLGNSSGDILRRHPWKGPQQVARIPDAVAELAIGAEGRVVWTRGRDGSLFQFAVGAAAEPPWRFDADDRFVRGPRLGPVGMPVLLTKDYRLVSLDGDGRLQTLKRLPSPPLTANPAEADAPPTLEVIGRTIVAGWPGTALWAVAPEGQAVELTVLACHKQRSVLSLDARSWLVGCADGQLTVLVAPSSPGQAKIGSSPGGG